MSRRSSPLLVVLALVLTRAGVSGAAEPERRGVRLEGAPGPCLDGAALGVLRAELAALAATDDVVVEIAEESGRITLAMRSGEDLLGLRVIDVDGAACPDVVRAAGLVMTVTLAALGVTRTEPATPVEAQEEAPSAADPAPARADPRGAFVPGATTPPWADAARPRGDLRVATVAAARPRGDLRVATAVDVGVGLALTGPATSLVSSVTMDVGYAPSGELSPELSGRGGFFVSFPARAFPDDRAVWLSLYASRWDLCGGIIGESFRLRGCAAVLGGGLVAVGAETSGLAAVGARAEGTWRATDRVGVVLATDALSVLYPFSLWTPPGGGSEGHAEELGPLSLVFSTGVVAAWL